jgi:hypothetical protein
MIQASTGPLPSIAGAVLDREAVKALLSDDHFSVDGTLIEAWASMKSFRPKSLPSGNDPGDGSGEPPAPGRNGERDFHGEKRSNETHASTTDRDARLYRKGPGQPAKLGYLGHVLMENRHALVVDTRLSLATGTAEREAALEMVADRPGNHRITLGADKANDAAEFVADLRELNVTPHVVQNTTNRRSAIDGRTTRHPGYAVSGRVPSASRRCLAGPRRPPAFARPVTVAWSASAGSSRSPPRPTISSGWPSWWEPWRSHGRTLSRFCPAPAQTIKIDPETCFSDAFSTT